MKDILFIWAIFILGGIILPLSLSVKTEEKQAFSAPESFTLRLTENGEVISLSPEDYIVGCLAAEIPLDFCQDALNAQAAASYTYALRLIYDMSASGEEPILTDDSRTCQPYYTPEKCREIYGAEFENYLPALTAAAEYGTKHPILYENEPIYAVYHSVSAGRTCSAYGVWGREFPYLKPVESAADRSFINYECTNEMTAEQARVLLITAKSDISAPADYAKWFSEFNANEDGYVISVKIGENLFSGGDIWRIFGLRSTAFTVSYQNGIFTFVTKGYGHGAGLSQYGANAMAKEGKTAGEILRHYYGEKVVF